MFAPPPASTDAPSVIAPPRAMWSGRFTIIFMLFTATVFGAGFALLRGATREPLRFTAEDTLHPALEAARGQFTALTGIRVQASYRTPATAAGASQPTVPVDLEFGIGPAAPAGAATSVGSPRVLIELHPLLIVPRGNPQRVQSLADARARGLRLALVESPADVLTQVSRRLLVESGASSGESAKLSCMDAMSVVARVAEGSAAAGIVWDTRATRQSERFDHVADPALASATAPYCVVIRAPAERRAPAEQFVAFLLDPEGGGAILRQHVGQVR